ncbi:transposase family protein [Micromonospora sp. MS34]|uniref:transposase family protein n=1 Tax=Micromonospora sp. MS34 TaxID=3385971 RepID=UPI0039A2711C
MDRSTVSSALRQVRPLLANRGFATPTGQRLPTLADALAYAGAEGLTVRLDGTEIQVRRRKANQPGRRACLSGKKKQNPIKATVASDAHGRPMWAGTIRPGRQNDQTAVRTEGMCGPKASMSSSAPTRRSVPGRRRLLRTGQGSPRPGHRPTAKTEE